MKQGKTPRVKGLSGHGNRCGVCVVVVVGWGQKVHGGSAEG